MMRGVPPLLCLLTLSHAFSCFVCRLESNKIGSEGAKSIADALLVNGSLTVVNVLCYSLNTDSAKMLSEVAKEKSISLCGISPDQTTANFSGHGLKPPDAILLASDLSQAGVSGSLTNLS
jgi:hypothetical protein